MKKILPLLIAMLALSPSLLRAQQDFNVAEDTVVATTVTTPVYDDITTSSTAGIKLNWKVVYSNFPADWLADTALGLCDNNVCYGNNSGALYPTGAAHVSNNYFAGSPGGFDYSPNLTGASPGTYLLTVQFNDLSGSRTATFVITRGIVSGINNINNFSSDVSLYPNPARDEVNVVYDANADIKNIAVYNIIGKVMAVYKVSGPSANLNLEAMPSGIYFVRLANSYGQVIATKKFTKQ